MLTIAIAGGGSGCNSNEALEVRDLKQGPLLRGQVPLPRGAPGQDILLRAFAAIDPVVLRRAFRSWATRLSTSRSRLGQIAIDGQTSRGNEDRASARSPEHVVNAFDYDHDLVTAPEPGDRKSDEICAVPLLLCLVCSCGALVSSISMGCRAQIAKAIFIKARDYLTGLKGDRSALHDQTAIFFDEVLSARRRPADAAQPPFCQHTVYRGRPPPDRRARGIHVLRLHEAARRLPVVGRACHSSASPQAASPLSQGRARAMRAIASAAER